MQQLEQAHAFLAVCLRLYMMNHMTRALSTSVEVCAVCLMPSTSMYMQLARCKKEMM